MNSTLNKSSNVCEKRAVVQLQRINTEVNNVSEDSGFSSISDGSVNSEAAPLVTDGNNVNSARENFKFYDPEFVTENNESTSKRRNSEKHIASMKIKREEFKREIQEKQYIRLMHLLKKSKAFTNFMVLKCSEEFKSKPKKAAKRKSTLPPTDSSVPKKEKFNDISNNNDFENKTVKGKLKEQDIIDDLASLSDEESSDKENDDKAFDCSELKYFKGKLRPYQEEGVKWLKVLYENGLNGILADEMGLGKTIQVIGFICFLIEKQVAGPFLIIIPLSLLGNWISECERFAPDIPIIQYYGKEETNKQIAKKILKKKSISPTCAAYPIVVTTYETVLNNEAFLSTLQFKYLIVDEAQRIKNRKSQLHRCLKNIRASNRLLLTGTPLQNNLSELYSLLNFLLPEIFNDLDVFEAWFDPKRIQDENEKRKLFQQEQEKHILSSLREILQPFMLRRLKEDVCNDIPETKEIIIYAPLTELQYDLYSAVLNRHLSIQISKDVPSAVVDVDGVRPKRKCTNKWDLMNYNQKTREHVAPPTKTIGDTDAESKVVVEWSKFTNVTEKNINYLSKMKHLCYHVLYKHLVNHPYIVYNPTYLNRNCIDGLVTDSGKMIVLEMMLEKLKAENHKILIFSTMTCVLDILEDFLLWKKYQYVRLDGTTSNEARKHCISEFNENPDIFIFLLTTKAGGVGLNLTAADTVIIYDSDWNPQNDLQAMARCHRIGQTKTVAVYRLVNKGTIDELILNRANAKRFLEKVIISGKKNIFKKEEIKELKELLDNNTFKAVDFKVYTSVELDKLLDRSNW